jgi:ParB/RepB/Spo0J family partition protein
VIDATKIHELPLTAVKVTRRREREELGDIEELAISIAKFGLLQPIVVDDDNELIAGFRRFTAHQQNGAVTILAIRQKDIDEATAKELELEENFRRKDMTTYERVKGLAELHRLRTEKDPNWNQVKTAQLAGGGTSQRDVSQAVSLNKMMDLFPELRKAKSINQAQNWAKAKAASVQRVIEVKENPKDYALTSSQNSSWETALKSSRRLPTRPSTQSSLTLPSESGTRTGQLGILTLLLLTRTMRRSTAASSRWPLICTESSSRMAGVSGSSE